MNAALETKNDKVLRDLLMISDRYRDPQGYVLAYDNAYKVGQAIVKNGDDIYLRAKNAAIECCNLVNEGAGGKLQLSRFETKALSDARAALDALPDNMDEFMDKSLTKYKEEVKVFRPENYGF
jgi:methanol--5-hydroxybenzimidazolylcobamide Co-methyltransferase